MTLIGYIVAVHHLWHERVGRYVCVFQDGPNFVLAPLPGGIEGYRLLKFNTDTEGYITAAWHNSDEILRAIRALGPLQRSDMVRTKSFNDDAKTTLSLLHVAAVESLKHDPRPISNRLTGLCVEALHPAGLWDRWVVLDDNGDQLLIVSTFDNIVCTVERSKWLILAEQPGYHTLAAMDRPAEVERYFACWTSTLKMAETLSGHCLSSLGA